MWQEFKLSPHQVDFKWEFGRTTKEKCPVVGFEAHCFLGQCKIQSFAYWLFIHFSCLSLVLAFGLADTKRIILCDVEKPESLHSFSVDLSITYMHWMEVTEESRWAWKEVNHGLCSTTLLIICTWNVTSSHIKYYSTVDFFRHLAKIFHFLS